MDVSFRLQGVRVLRDGNGGSHTHIQGCTTGHNLELAHVVPELRPARPRPGG